MRVVVDPGVFVSALISSTGPPAQLVSRWLGGEFEAVVSPLLLGELRQVLARDKFRNRLSIDDARALALLIEASCIAVADERDPPTFIPDPDDTYLVALAVRSCADVLVTGDRALQGAKLDPVLVLSPSALLALLDSRID